MTSDGEPTVAPVISASEDGGHVVDVLQSCCVDPLARVWHGGDWQVKLSLLGVALLVLLWSAIAAAWAYWGNTITEAFHERNMVLSLSRSNSNMSSERTSSNQSTQSSVGDMGSFSFSSTPSNDGVATLDMDEDKKNN